METISHIIQSQEIDVALFTFAILAKKPPLVKPHIETKQLDDIEACSDLCIVDSQQDDN